MKTSELADTNIFRSNSQIMAIDPARIKPVWDRVLVRDIKDEDKIGSIWIPDTAAERGLGKNGLLRMGVVVAIGPGDPWARERVVTARKGDVMGGSHIERKALGACLECNGAGIFFSTEALKSDGRIPGITCRTCGGDGIRRWPMYCKPGDVIVYDRRKEAEIFIEGERYSLIHEEQSVYAVLEEAS